MSGRGRKPIYINDNQEYDHELARKARIERSREYYKENKEQIREKAKNYYQMNKEKIRQNQREYYTKKHSYEQQETSPKIIVTPNFIMEIVG